ncbi:ligand-gated channel [Bacteroidia bacterium]|nr:ligand-gated channel [Bacteroidia bacterium]
MRSRSLEEVTVTDKSKPSTLKALSPVQVISKAELTNFGFVGMADAVRRFAGVTVKDYGGIGGLKTVSIRSLGAQHTTVSYDGVVVGNSQAGQIDLGRFSLDNVGSISLTVGPESDIFQSARMFSSAGVLSIQTEQPSFTTQKTDEFRVNLKGGSFGFLNSSARYGRKLTNKSFFSLDGNYLRADGTYPFTLVNGRQVTQEKRTNSDIETVSAEGNFYCRFRDSARMSLKVYFFDSEQGLPASVILYNPEQNQRLWNRNFFVQGKYDTDFSPFFSLKGQLKYNYSLSKYQDKDPRYQGGIQRDKHREQEYYGSLAIRYRSLGGFTAALATDVIRNELQSDIPDALNPERYTGLLALSSTYSRNFFTATANLAGTYITEKVLGSDKERHPAAADDRKRLSPSLAVSVRPWSQSHFYVRASAKNTFRVPTFNDLYYLRVGNRNLRAEIANEYNVGLTWGTDVLPFTEYTKLTVDAYHNEVKDKIVALPTMYIWKMMNMGKVRIEGLDVTMNVAVAGIPLETSSRPRIIEGERGENPNRNEDNIHIRAAINYTFQHAIDITDPSAKNYKHQIPYTPEHTVSGVLNIETPWVSASYTLMGVSERYVLPQNTQTNRVDGYVEHSVNLYRTFEWQRLRVRVQLEAINITDEQYDVIKYYPMPGRSYRAVLSAYF